MRIGSNIAKLMGRGTRMLNDVVIVGAGPVGAALALALAEADLSIAVLDARAEGGIGRTDRSLALSHGARLIFERLAVWSEVSSTPGAVTAITAIDISQRGGFGAVRLDAREQHLPALGYVVSYRALQSALDAALARAGVAIDFGVTVSGIRTTPAYAVITADRDGVQFEKIARLVAVADGAGGLVESVRRRKHDYAQVALIGKLWLRESHGGVAFERFTPEGPMALLPEGDHYALVWTTTAAHAAALVAMPQDDFLVELARRFGSRVTGYRRVEGLRVFPLALEFAERVIEGRTVLLGNAAQALHPVAGQGFNLGVRDAHELAQELLSIPRDRIGARESLAAYARRRRIDRSMAIGFTHGLLRVFGSH